MSLAIKHNEAAVATEAIAQGAKQSLIAQAENAQAGVPKRQFDDALVVVER